MIQTYDYVLLEALQNTSIRSYLEPNSRSVYAVFQPLNQLRMDWTSTNRPALVGNNLVIQLLETLD